MFPRPFIFILLFFFGFAALHPAEADLSGQMKYGYETDYLDFGPTRQTFSQEYLTNVRGAILDDRIGSYQLGIQYQKGTTELKNLTFSNALNFQDFLKIGTSYFRKEFGNLQFGYPPIADNHFSVNANYFVPSFPSVSFAYETGDAQSASLEGVSKTDKKSEFGVNYSIGGGNLSARYSRSTLSDNTYLSSAANLVNRDSLFSLNGIGEFGEMMKFNGGYSEQEIYNRTGSSSLYNQKLKNLVAAGSLKLGSNLSLNPEFSDTVNEVEYVLPNTKTNQQNSKRIGMSINVKPVDLAEFIIDIGTGQIELLDDAGAKRQDLASGKVGMNLNFDKDFYLNLDFKNESYSNGTNAGNIIYANGYLTYLLEKGIKLSYKRYLTDFSGEIYALMAGGVMKQDSHDWGIGIVLPNSLSFDGGVSVSSVNAYAYRGISAGIKYAPTSLVLYELKRENKFGNEVTQTVELQTDSVKASFSFFNANVSEQLFLIRNKTVSNSSTLNRNGFRNNTEVNYSLGESTVNFSLNSEKGDQFSSAYSRANLYFARNF